MGAAVKIEPTFAPDQGSRGEPFMAFVADEVTRAILARVAVSQGWNEASVLVGGPEEAAVALAGVATPQMLVIDIGQVSDPLAELGALAEVCDPGTRVIALGDVNDIAFYRCLIDNGIEDYLVKPVTPDALATVVSRPAPGAQPEPQDADPENEPGRLVAVVGARGGVGATTVAANTAWLMAHEMGRKVVLVDLDLFFGDVALALDIEPGRGFLEALENPDRIDGLFLQRALVRESDQLFVLGAEESLDQQIAFRPEAMSQLLTELRRGFDVVVLDLPRFGARTQIPLITPPSSLIVVSDLSLSGMRDSMRLRTFANNVIPGTDVKLVVNRVGAAGKSEMSKVDFARGAGGAISHAIPFDPAAAAEGAGQGKTISQVAPRSKAASVLRALARDVGGVEEQTAEPAWRRLLKRRA